jgi:pyruvate ferredoxin oxidoreductase gamma subunit
MKEIRIHARAGQGAITAAMLLATAAFEEGRHALAFPHFGSERMGAPLNAFVRLGTDPIRVRSQVRTPDYVIVQDPTLLRGFDVTAGLKPGGVVLVNTSQTPEELGLKTHGRVVTVAASRIAEEIIGRADRANTALLGAFAAATGEVSLEALKRAARGRFSGQAGERNAQALERAYDWVKSQKKGNGS